QSAIEIPDWVTQPAPPEARPPRPLAPSAIAVDDESAPPPSEAMRLAALRGTWIHQLLERLPAVEAGKRPEAAGRWLERSAGVSAHMLVNFCSQTGESPAMATTTVTDQNFATDVLGSERPVLVDFWAEWCGPCRMIGPALEEIAGELGDKVTVAKLNIDENPDTPGRYGVRGIPTMLLFKGGQPVAQKVGAAPRSQIQQWLEGNL